MHVSDEIYNTFRCIEGTESPVCAGLGAEIFPRSFWTLWYREI